MQISINYNVPSIWDTGSLSGADTSKEIDPATGPLGGGRSLSSPMMQKLMALVYSMLGDMFKDAGMNPEADSTATQLPKAKAPDKPAGTSPPPPATGAAGATPPATGAAPPAAGATPPAAGATPPATGAAGVAGSTPAGAAAYATLKKDIGDATTLSDKIGANPGQATPADFEKLKTQNAKVSQELQDMPVAELRANRTEVKAAMDAFQASAEKTQAAVKASAGADSQATADATTALASAATGVGVTYSDWRDANVRDGVTVPG